MPPGLAGNRGAGLHRERLFRRCGAGLAGQRDRAAGGAGRDLRGRRGDGVPGGRERRLRGRPHRQLARPDGPPASGPASSRRSSSRRASPRPSSSLVRSASAPSPSPSACRYTPTPVQCNTCGFRALPGGGAGPAEAPSGRAVELLLALLELLGRLVGRAGRDLLAALHLALDVTGGVPDLRVELVLRLRDDAAAPPQQRLPLPGDAAREAAARVAAESGAMSSATAAPTVPRPGPRRRSEPVHAMSSATNSIPRPSGQERGSDLAGEVEQVVDTPSRLHRRTTAKPDRGAMYSTALTRAGRRCGTPPCARGWWPRSSPGRSRDLAVVRGLAAPGRARGGRLQQHAALIGHRELRDVLRSGGQAAARHPVADVAGRGVQQLADPPRW